MERLTSPRSARLSAADRALLRDARSQAQAVADPERSRVLVDLADMFEQLASARLGTEYLRVKRDLTLDDIRRVLKRAPLHE